MHIVLMMYIPWWCKQKEKSLSCNTLAAPHSNPQCSSCLPQIRPTAYIFLLSAQFFISPSLYLSLLVNGVMELLAIIILPFAFGFVLCRSPKTEPPNILFPISPWVLLAAGSDRESAARGGRLIARRYLRMCFVSESDKPILSFSLFFFSFFLFLLPHFPDSVCTSHWVITSFSLSC